MAGDGLSGLRLEHAHDVLRARRGLGRRSPAQLHAHDDQDPVPVQLELDAIAGAMRLDGAQKVVAFRHPHPIDREQHVAGLDARFLGGRVRDGAHDGHAVRALAAELDPEKRALVEVSTGAAQSLSGITGAAQPHAVEQELTGRQALQLEHVMAGAHRDRIEPDVERTIRRRAGQRELLPAIASQGHLPGPRRERSPVRGRQNPDRDLVGAGIRRAYFHTQRVPFNRIPPRQRSGGGKI
jgi:hypothetical protein